MRILILGGTRFVGRHLTAEALARGHRVSLFNRGKSNPGVFSEAEELVGDRDGDLAALEGREWDCVVDVNGYVPRIVGDSAKLLSGSVQRYVFISTLSVYASFASHGQDENAPLAATDDLETEEITAGSYGPLKVLCEQAAEAAFPGRTLVIRPGYVVGPYDHTDRLTSWVRRVGQGGEMLAPGLPECPIQFVDGRDLAAFTLLMAEEGSTGVFNVTGPAEQLTWGAFLEACRSVQDADTRITWVDEEFVQEQGLAGNDLPMWPPEEIRGVMAFDVSKARAAGLRYRPLEETIRDTLAWDAESGEARAGLGADRENELLAAWRKWKSGS